MTTYYVSKSGNDTNTGTESNPWLTIQKAADIAVAGDIVYVIGNTEPYNEYVTITKSGVDGKPIIFSTIGTVTVTHSYTLMPSWSGLFWIKNQKYIIIDGFRLIGGRSSIWINKSSNIIIQNNYCENPYTNGIEVYGQSNYITITNNIVNRFATTGIIYAEMISLSFVHNFIVIHNFLVGNTIGENIVVKDACTYGEILYNLTQKSTMGIYVGGSQPGLDGLGAHDIDVHHNIAINNSIGVARGGIFVANEMAALTPTKPTNIIVHDNWASEQTYGIGLGIAHPTTPLKPTYGIIIFKDNKSCGNSAGNYFYPQPITLFTIDELIIINNDEPTSCIVPIPDCLQPQCDFTIKQT